MRTKTTGDKMTDYKIKVLDEKPIQNGEKLKLALIDKEKDETVYEEWLRLSDWQLEEGLERRLKQWGKRRCDCLEEREVGVKGKEFDL